jgi:hypothetical protein
MVVSLEGEGRMEKTLEDKLNEWIDDMLKERHSRDEIMAALENKIENMTAENESGGDDDA